LKNIKGYLANYVLNIFATTPILTSIPKEGKRVNKTKLNTGITNTEEITNQQIACRICRH
jgi:hypothetical protein